MASTIPTFDIRRFTEPSSPVDRQAFVDDLGADSLDTVELVMAFEEEFGIEHYPADCVQCRTCEDICMKQCLTLSDEVPIKELVEGVIERIDMTPMKYKPNDPKQIYHHMYDLLGGGQIYER